MPTQLHMLLPVGQESVIHLQVESGTFHLGEFVLKPSRDNGVKGRTKVHKEYPRIGASSVQGAILTVIHRPV